MTGSDFSGFGAIYGLLMVIMVIFFPLGVWKAVEIVIWIFTHVHLKIV